MNSYVTAQKRRMLLSVVMLFPLAAFSQTTPEELANAISYSVPVSPAFELLPSKPSEVSSIVTPKDVYTTVPSFVSNGKLKTGVSADIRPVSSFINTTLTQYQRRNWLKRALWRTVLAVGTAPDPTNNNDAFLSTGLRIPIIDKGDPRANKEYTDKLTKAYSDGISALGPPPFNITTEQLKVRSKAGSAAADVERQKLSKETWNKLKVDVGAAYMIRAKSSSYLPDSLKGNRWGGWAAAAFGIGKITQINITGKATNIIQVTDDKGETSRYVAGTRARFFCM